MTNTATRKRPADHPAFLPLVMATACLVGLFLTSAPASAQVEPIEAKWMTVTRDTPMRCGELATFYKVADLKAGDVVRVDALSPRWARLVYPAAQYAFVASRDAASIVNGQLTLTDSARVRAPNAISGLTGSWRSLYLGEIQPGANLKVVGEAKASDGQIVGFRIEPPRPPIAPHMPWGYTERSALRDATQAEVAAHQASLTAAEPSESKDDAILREPTESQATNGTKTPTQAENKEDAQPAASDLTTSSGAQTQPEPDQTGSDKPADSEPSESTSQTDTSLLEDMIPPSTEPTSQSQPQQEAIQNESSSPETATPEPSTAPPPVPIQTWLNWPDLEAELARVRRSGGSVLEESLDELIAEYDRTLANTQTPNVHAALSSRLDWLRARRDARDQRLALDAALANAQRLKEDAQTSIQTWRAARGYDIVGRLVPSAIYDGRRLPRMIRIQAVAADGLVRTIGYIRDTEALDLDDQLGQIVGVVGEARLDQSLRLRVITPRSVDRLGPAASARPGG